MAAGRLDPRPTDYDSLGTSSATSPDDCVMVADGERTLGVLHGTDCNLSISVQNQLGKARPETIDSNFAGRSSWPAGSEALR